MAACFSAGTFARRKAQANSIHFNLVQYSHLQDQLFSGELSPVQLAGMSAADMLPEVRDAQCRVTVVWCDTAGVHLPLEGSGGELCITSLTSRRGQVVLKSWQSFVSHALSVLCSCLVCFL